MNYRIRYENQIETERVEYAKKIQMIEQERAKNLRERTDFGRYCKKIYNTRKWFQRAYKAREKMGLPPWSHAYDYPCSENIWKAKAGFKAIGRYGADSGDIVFVPEDANFDVICCDHTTVIDLRPEKLKEAYFIPAYSNTV